MQCLSTHHANFLKPTCKQQYFLSDSYKGLILSSVLKFCCLHWKYSNPCLFFLVPDSSFPLCHPFPFSWTVCAYHLLIFVAITQSTVLKISSGFSLYPVSGSCFPSYVSQNVCLQTKSHFPFKNELSSRWQPFKFAKL